MRALGNHIKLALKNPRKSINPKPIVHKLKSIWRRYRFGRQEDAHEFLRLFVDGLQASCLSGYERLDFKTKSTTILHSIFGGQTCSSVSCPKCGYKSNTFEPSLDISLEIKSASSLSKALRLFTKSEQLNSDNTYKCAGCQKSVRATKQMKVYRAPRVLTCHLKRFDFTYRQGRKINRHVEFEEHLDLGPYMSASQKTVSHLYSLYGVLVHEGHSNSSGHYYAYVKAPNGLWYCMDDTSVSSVKLAKVLKQQAYILFYTRTSPPQPSPMGLRPSPAPAPAPAAVATTKAAAKSKGAVGPQTLAASRQSAEGAAGGGGPSDEVARKGAKSAARKGAAPQAAGIVDKVKAAVSSSDEDEDGDEDGDSGEEAAHKGARRTESGGANAGEGGTSSDESDEEWVPPAAEAKRAKGAKGAKAGAGAGKVGAGSTASTASTFSQSTMSHWTVTSHTGASDGDGGPAVAAAAAASDVALPTSTKPVKAAKKVQKGKKKKDARGGVPPAPEAAVDAVVTAPSPSTRGPSASHAAKGDAPVAKPGPDTDTIDSIESIFAGSSRKAAVDDSDGGTDDDGDDADDADDAGKVAAPPPASMRKRAQISFEYSDESSGNSDDSDDSNQGDASNGRKWRTPAPKPTTARGGFRPHKAPLEVNWDDSLKSKGDERRKNTLFDGSRKKSAVVSELTTFTFEDFGSAVTSWDGDINSVQRSRQAFVCAALC